MPVTRPPSSRSYTQEERVALVSEISRRVAAGEGTVETVALALGTRDKNYYNWRRAALQQVAQPVAEPLPAAVAAGRRRYTPAEREALVAKIDEMRAAGQSQEVACKAVGIADSSYRAWRLASTPPAMRPVEVRALVPVPAPTALAPPRPAASAAAVGALVLVAPGGYRVEGLSVDSAAALLRALS